MLALDCAVLVGHAAIVSGWLHSVVRAQFFVAAGLVFGGILGKVAERRREAVGAVLGRDTGGGLIRVSVVPSDAVNSPPEPPVLESRSVAGGTVVLQLPGAGIDPRTPQNRIFICCLPA